MPDVYLKIDPVPSKVVGGINLDIGVCFQKGRGSEKCEMVDRLVFDKKDVEREVPQQVMEMLRKSVTGEYWEEGCKRLGLPMKGGRCGKPVAGTSPRTYEPKKTEEAKPETKRASPAKSRGRRK